MYSGQSCLYCMESPAQGVWCPHSLEVEVRMELLWRDWGLNIFLLLYNYKKRNQQKKSTISNPLMFGYSKSAITLFLFSFTVLGKNCVQAFLSLGSAEESSRGFHALLTFVSSLWWCFFLSPHREWVWSEVTEVIGFKCDKLSRGTFAIWAALQSGSIWILSCAIWD